ncbi:hypothetical protein GJ496_008814 [Pomphorhynchus laevis]|nr:hypothetical protein GJ496_008814 [Pomphorhynchus laevis]
MNLDHDEIRVRKRQDRERKRKELRDAAEKKKRFGLTPEKKRKLRILIRKKAAEDLKNEASISAQRKSNFMAEKVKPLQSAEELTALDDKAIGNICAELHKIIERLESEKYDIEYQIMKSDLEINELTIKINDIAGGKFTKPVLKKVSQVEGKLHKISKKDQLEADFRKNLKSTGINKYALEDEKEEEKINLRNQLKHVGDKEDELA